MTSVRFYMVWERLSMQSWTEPLREKPQHVLQGLRPVHRNRHHRAGPAHTG